MDSFNYIYGLFGYIAALERFDSKDIFDMLPFRKISISLGMFKI